MLKNFHSHARPQLYIVMNIQIQIYSYIIYIQYLFYNTYQLIIKHTYLWKILHNIHVIGWIFLYHVNNFKSIWVNWFPSLTVCMYQLIDFLIYLGDLWIDSQYIIYDIILVCLIFECKPLSVTQETLHGSWMISFPKLFFSYWIWSIFIF